MSTLEFQSGQPVSPPDPNRTDVACFVGFVGRRDTSVPPVIAKQLAERRGVLPDAVDETLRDVPVPIESWDVFDELFEWERRDLDGNGLFGTTYLGAAVQSFFSQGGRKCYVVAVDEPRPLVTRADAGDRLGRLIPGYADTPTAQVTSSPADPSGWRGVGHLLGLPDVSFVCLPDVADVIGFQIESPDAAEPPSLPESWVPCSQPQSLPAETSLAGLTAPRCDDDGYRRWSFALGMIADFLGRHKREVICVADVPLPAPALSVDGHMLEYLVHGDKNLLGQAGGPLSRAPRQFLPGEGGLPWRGFASAFIQLGWPWLRTKGSQRLPEQLECPCGPLTGMLARNALTQGTFRNAVKLDAGGVYDVFPVVDRFQLNHLVDGRSLPQRVSVFGPTPYGVRLLSDVTASLMESYRPASVSRLVSAILRAARRLGEGVAFDTNGQATWQVVTQQLSRMLFDFYRAGALGGATAADAFTVRCDRSTMSDNDIQNGRVVAEVQLTASAPIERLTVTLVLDEAGQVSLTAGERFSAEEAA